MVDLSSFDNLDGSEAESTYRDRLKASFHMTIGSNPGRAFKLKWEYDNEIDAFYKIRECWNRKIKKQ